MGNTIEYARMLHICSKPTEERQILSNNLRMAPLSIQKVKLCRVVDPFLTS